MKTLRLISLSLILLAYAETHAWAGSAAEAREAMAEGLNAYEAQEFDRAAGAFAEAADLASGTRLDAAVGHFNEGNAHLGQGRPDQAAAQFAEALRTADLGLQQRAYFNRGNALMAGAAALEAQQMLDPAMKAVDEATTMYEQSMRLDPGDVDPKANYELALKKLEELAIKQEQQQEQQQQQGQDEQQQNQDRQDQEQQGEQQGDREQQNQDESSSQEPQDQQSGQQDQQEQRPDGDPREDAEQQQDPGQSTDTEAEPIPSEEMTKDEAEMMLDAKREEERADRERVRLRLGPPREVEKDW